MVVHLCSHRVSRVRRYSGYFYVLSVFNYGTLTLCRWPSHAIRLTYRSKKKSEPLGTMSLGLAYSAFARHYLRNLGWCLFLALLRCFSSGGSLPYPILFRYGWQSIALPGFPIRKSPDQRLCAAPRSLSQLVTSFIGSWCQGIPLALFLAWPMVFSTIASSQVQNYAGFTNRLNFEIVIVTLNLIKVPQLIKKFRYLPLCCLAFS